MDSAAIENLAVNGRDPLVLARLAPGIADVAAGGVGFNVNGGRDNTTNYTVDGVSNIDTGNNGVLGSINLDAVEEFKILTNAYSAEYGRSSGAQVSLVTKSGGRDYRGSVYGYRRQESFNANSWINNRERGRALESNPASTVGLKPINRQTDAGFTVGGPVPLGGYNKDRNRLFFFFAFENQRRTPPANPNRVKVPTELERRRFLESVDNNNKPTTSFATTPPACPAPRAAPAAASGRRRLGAFPSRLYAPGLAILNAPIPAERPQRGLQLRVAGGRVRIDRRGGSSAPTGRRRRRGASGRYFHNSTTPAPASARTARSTSATCRASNADIRPVYNVSRQRHRRPARRCSPR